MITLHNRIRPLINWLTGIALAGTAIAGWGSEMMPDYEISPEDVLEVSVWKEPDLQRRVIVRPDGGISFPLAGNLTAAGLTTTQLEEALSTRIKKFVPDAVVTVSVVELKGLRIFVAGKVRSPGQYTVGRYVDVLQAIALAGGLTPFADRNDIRIIRREDGQEVIYEFNYGQVERGRALEQNILLRAGDVVMVP